jgi:hypothetical protein
METCSHTFFTWTLTMVDRGYAIVICSDRSTASARVATRAPSGLDLPALSLLLLGLLANVSSQEEVYTNPEYGFSIFALFGAAGCIGHLAASLSRSSGALDFANRILVRALTVAAVPGGYPAGAGEWPVLVALLFGPLVFLLSGLGGWV